MAGRIPWGELFQAAQQARLRAYAPYSGFGLGAAVMGSDREIYAGCNVENSSYGLSVCAERSAIFRAVAEGNRRILAVAIVCDATAPCPPCGMCRQVMAELATPDLPVRSRNLRGAEERYLLRRLLPHAFSSRFLKKRSSPPGSAKG